MTSGTYQGSASGMCGSSSRTPCGRFGPWTSTWTAWFEIRHRCPRRRRTSGRSWPKTIRMSTSPCGLGVKFLTSVTTRSMFAEVLAERVGRVAERAASTTPVHTFGWGHRAARLPRDTSGRVGRAHVRYGRRSRSRPDGAVASGPGGTCRFWPTSWRTTTSVMCSWRSPAGRSASRTQHPAHDRIRVSRPACRSAGDRLLHGARRPRMHRVPGRLRSRRDQSRAARWR